VACPAAVAPDDSVLKKLWQFIEYLLAQAALALISALPVRGTLALADALGWLGFHLLPGRARIAVNNLLAAQVAPDKRAARHLGCRCFQSFTRLIAETVLGRKRLHAGNWREFVTFEGSPEALALLHQPKQGAIIASAHLGNWEIAARAVSMIHPVSVIYRPLNNPWLERELHGERGGENLRLISKYKASPLRFVKLLAAGEWLALMIDQHIHQAGERVRVNFFGRPCWTTRSVAMMHLTTRMPVVTALAVREGPMKFKVYLHGPVAWTRTGDREKDVLAITQSLTDQIEKVARQYPEQYLWGHRRWRE